MQCGVSRCAARCGERPPALMHYALKPNVDPSTWYEQSDSEIRSRVYPHLMNILVYPHQEHSSFVYPHDGTQRPL